MTVGVWQNPEGPKFELHGVELYGSFTVYFSGKWYLQHFEYKETKVSGAEMQKLVEAAKTGAEVPIKFGNGEGKAKIISIGYDPDRHFLTGISIELTDWVEK